MFRTSRSPEQGFSKTFDPSWLAADGTTLYLVDTAGSVESWDLTDPLHPRRMGFYGDGKRLTGIDRLAAANGIAVAATDLRGVLVLRPD